MLKNPNIVLLEPPEEEAEIIREAFGRHSYDLKIMPNLAALRAGLGQERTRFDSIVVPLQLRDLSSGITACIQLKSDEALATTPIVALSVSKDKAVIQAFYGAGADVVFMSPFDADMIYMQIGSLTRLKRAFDEQISQGFQDSGLLHPVIEAFHGVREGLLLLDITGQAVFANQSARKMLGLREARMQDDLGAISDQLRPLTKSAGGAQRPQAARSSEIDLSVRRINNDSFKARVTLTPICRANREPVGYSLAMVDLSEIQHLGNTLMQAQRTRSLCLITTAACMRFLENMNQGGRVSAIQYLDEVLQQSSRSCQLNSTLTSLLEALDLVMNPKMSVKVRVEQDLYLAVRPADFFQLVGHLVLHAAEHAGLAGETSILTTGNIPGEGVAIIVAAESRRVTPFQSQDQISQLIQSDFSNVGAPKDGSEKLSFGLVAAQRIADKYRAVIEYQQPSETLMKIRVRLPVGHRPT